MADSLNMVSPDLFAAGLLVALSLAGIPLAYSGGFAPLEFLESTRTIVVGTVIGGSLPIALLGLAAFASGMSGTSLVIAVGGGALTVGAGAAWIWRARRLLPPGVLAAARALSWALPVLRVVVLPGMALGAATGVAFAYAAYGSLLLGARILNVAQDRRWDGSFAILGGMRSGAWLGLPGIAVGAALLLGAGPVVVAASGLGGLALQVTFETIPDE